MTPTTNQWERVNLYYYVMTIVKLQLILINKLVEYFCVVKITVTLVKYVNIFLKPVY